MDLLKKIKSKIKLISDIEGFNGIKAVARHIEIAERYLNRAIEENEEDLFNDVIYRTNQAFEGILKEAYNVLNSSDASRLKTYEIENYLLENNVLTERVLNLFKNYRKYWRNDSTHDYKLFFDEEEALLAIMNVSAFVNILLNQIIEVVNFKKKQAESHGKMGKVKEEINNYNMLSFEQKLTSLLKKFYMMSSTKDLNELSEAAIVGQIGGFLSSMDPEMEVLLEVQLPGLVMYRTDIVCVKGDEKIFIEIKKYSNDLSHLYRERGKDQLFTYLSHGDFNGGILWYIPIKHNNRIDSSSNTINIGDKKYSYTIIE